MTLHLIFEKEIQYSCKYAKFSKEEDLSKLPFVIMPQFENYKGLMKQRKRLKEGCIP